MRNLTSHVVSDLFHIFTDDTRYSIIDNIDFAIERRRFAFNFL